MDAHLLFLSLLHLGASSVTAAAVLGYDLTLSGDAIKEWASNPTKRERILIGWVRYLA